MAHTVVCISSHDGTGAEEVARRVAGELGYRVLDEDIVERAAIEAGVETEAVTDVERQRSRLLGLVEALGAGAAPAYGAVDVDFVARTEPPREALRGMIRSVIEESAAAGGAVIVSHAASLALAGREDVLRVLVTAPPTTRERRLAETLGVEEKEAARILKRSDANRASYIKRFYGIGDELPTHYDLVFNTERLAPERVAELIIRAAT